MMTKRKRTAKSAAAPPKTPVKAKKPKKAKKAQRYAARRHPQTEAEREERRVLHLTFHRMDDHGRIALFELVRKGIGGRKAAEVALAIGAAVEAERTKRVPPEYDHESDDDAVLHVTSQFDNADEIVDELLRASMHYIVLHPKDMQSNPIREEDHWLRVTAKNVWDAAIRYAELMEAKRPPRRAGILTRRIL
jgi:hypothetical protein